MFEKIGLPRNLLWGYIGLTIFMIGVALLNKSNFC